MNKIKKIVSKKKTLILLTSMLTLALMFIFMGERIFASEPDATWTPGGTGTEAALCLTYTDATNTLRITGDGTVAVDKNTFSIIPIDYKEKIKNVVFEGTNTTNKLSIVPNKLFCGTEANYSLSNWNEICDYIETIDLGNVKIKDGEESCKSMFQSLKNLKSVDFGINFDVTNITDFSFMFCYCISIKNVDLRTFKPSGSVQMNSMFYRCDRLEDIIFANDSLWKVTTLEETFSFNKFNDFSFNNFDLSNCTNMRSTFYACYELETVDFKDKSTSNVENMAKLFESCHNLRDIKFGKNFDTAASKCFSYMFKECHSLVNLDCSQVALNDESNMFKLTIGQSWNDLTDFASGCKSLKTINFANVDFSNVCYCQGLFNTTSILDVIDLRGAIFPQTDDSLVNMFAITRANIIYLPQTFACDNIRIGCLYYGKKLNGTEDLSDDNYYNDKEIITKIRAASDDCDYLEVYKRVDEIFELNTSGPIYYTDDGTATLNVVPKTTYTLSDLIDDLEYSTISEGNNNDFRYDQYAADFEFDQQFSQVFDITRNDFKQTSYKLINPSYDESSKTYSWWVAVATELDAGNYTINLPNEKFSATVQMYRYKGSDCSLVNEWKTPQVGTFNFTNDETSTIKLYFTLRISEDDLDGKTIDEYTKDLVWTLPDEFDLCSAVPGIWGAIYYSDVKIKFDKPVAVVDNRINTTKRLKPYLYVEGQKVFDFGLVRVRNSKMDVNVHNYKNGTLLNTNTILRFEHNTDAEIPLSAPNDENRAKVMFLKFNELKYIYELDIAMTKTVDLSTTNTVKIENIDNDYKVLINYFKYTPTPPGGGGGGGGGGASTPTYTITIKDEDGKVIGEVKVKDGKITDFPKDPEKDGYIFDGYFFDDKFEKTFDKDSKITSNMTIFIKWKEKMKWKAYIKGYEDGTFKPNNFLTRAEVATIVARLCDDFDEDKNYGQDSYPDTKKNYWYTNYIRFVTDKNIFEGYPDGEFKPERSISRGELAKVLCLLYDVKFSDVDSKNVKKFGDIKEGAFYKDYANALLSKGRITGYEDGTFMGENSITRAETCTMINNILKSKIGQIDQSGLTNKFNDIKESDWFYKDVVLASSDIE